MRVGARVGGEFVVEGSGDWGRLGGEVIKGCDGGAEGERFRCSYARLFSWGCCWGGCGFVGDFDLRVWWRWWGFGCSF